jgi:hypothetical protein
VLFRTKPAAGCRRPELGVFDRAGRIITFLWLMLAQSVGRRIPSPYGSKSRVKSPSNRVPSTRLRSRYPNSLSQGPETASANSYRYDQIVRPTCAPSHDLCYSPAAAPVPNGWIAGCIIDRGQDKHWRNPGRKDKNIVSFRQGCVRWDLLKPSRNSFRACDAL